MKLWRGRFTRKAQAMAYKRTNMSYVDVSDSKMPGGHRIFKYWLYGTIDSEACLIPVEIFEDRVVVYPGYVLYRHEPRFGVVVGSFKKDSVGITAIINDTMKAMMKEHGN